MTRQHRAIRFLVCTGSILSCILTFEVAGVLGVIDYRAVFSTPTPPWRRPGNRPDPDLIFVKDGPRVTRVAFTGVDMARMRGNASRPVYDREVRYDRNGFRNLVDRVSAEVIVIGDSFVEGLQVAPEELVTHQLSARLGRTVVNLGRSGYGPQQELHVLSRYGLGFHPRVCVWACYEGNDLQDLNNYEVQRKGVRRFLKAPPSRRCYDRSLTWNGLDFAIRRWIRPDPGLPVELFTGRMAVPSGQDQDLVFATGLQHDDAGPWVPRESCLELRKLQAILREAHELCDQAGAELAIVFVPAKFRIYGGLCRFSPDSPCRSWQVDDLPGRWDERSVSSRPRSDSSI